MNKINKLLITLLLSFATSSTFAHALWIETASTGKINEQHTVKIFYGEFAANERDSLSKWYSDVKEFTLWLVDPDQKKTKLTLNPGANYFESAFTPRKNGSYTLMVSHEAKELGGTTKYHFLSNASIAVGEALPAAAHNDNVLQLHINDVLSPKINKPVLLKVLLKEAAAKGKTVSVFSPKGWSKELKTDANGQAEFIPLWAGRYMIEVSDMDRTPGKHNGKDFTSTWKGATYSFEVRK